MPAPANIIDAAAVDKSLSQEFVRNFKNDFDRLAEIIGVFGGAEVRQAGAAINQFKIDGTLNAEAYVEGAEVGLSKYTVRATPIAELAAKPYRKMTTAAAIMKAGYEKAVVDTDAKMLSQVRAAVIGDFFTFLGNGTGTAKGATVQAALAVGDATLLDTMETNSDATDAPIIHFMNRQDAAAYLGSATITDQSLFGMTYLENFLGVTNVFLTNKVAHGTVYMTPANNIKVYGVDFTALANGGLVYEQDGNGLIGVHHSGAYDHFSAATDIAVGAQFVPEITDYIVKTTIGE